MGNGGDTDSGAYGRPGHGDVGRSKVVAPSVRVRSAPSPVARICALGAASLLLADAVFQIGLAAGAPWGAAAWGGKYVHLPTGLRVASAVSVVVLAVLASAVLRFGGWRVPVAPPTGWLRPMMWVVTGFAVLNTMANLASRSATERTVMGPATVALALLCGTLAIVGARAKADKAGLES